MILVEESLEMILDSEEFIGDDFSRGMHWRWFYDFSEECIGDDF